MAEIDILIGINDGAAISKLEQLKKKADAAEQSMARLGVKIGADAAKTAAGYEKSIKAVEKLNTLLNKKAQASNKFAAANTKAFDHLTGSIFKSLAAVNLLMKGFHLIGSVLHKAFDFGKESYEGAVSLNQEKAALGSSYESNGRTNVKELIASMDRLAHENLLLGISMKETFQLAKVYSNLYPGANQAASENFIKTAGVMAASMFHGNLEQSGATLKMIEGSIEMGMRPGIRQLTRAGFPISLAKSIVALEKESKSTGKKIDNDKLLNLIEKVIYNKQGPEAIAMREADPLSYFKAKLEETSNTLGQTLIKVFKTPGMQEMINGWIKKFDDFIRNLTPEKITGWMEDIAGFVTTIVNAGMAIADFIAEHLGKSKYQRKQENDNLRNFLFKSDEYRKAYPELMKFGAADEITTGEQNRLTGKHGVIDLQKLRTEWIDKIRSGGEGDLLAKYENNPVIKEFIHSLNKFTESAFTITQSTGKSGVWDFIKKGLAEGAKRGVIDKEQLNLINETSGVTGNKPTIININIGEQVHQLNVSGGVTSQQAQDIKQQILSVLDDAINSAESLIGQ